MKDRNFFHTRTLHKSKVHIKKKGRVYEFQDKGKVDVMDFWEQKKNIFNTVSWYRDDDHSVVFTKLGQPKK